MKSVIIFMMLCLVVYGYDFTCDVEVATDGSGINCTSVNCVDEIAECESMAGKIGIAWQSAGSWADDAPGCLHYNEWSGVWYNKNINSKPCTAAELCVKPIEGAIEFDGGCHTCIELKSLYDSGSDCESVKQVYKANNCC